MAFDLQDRLGPSMGASNSWSKTSKASGNLGKHGPWCNDNIDAQRQAWPGIDITDLLTKCGYPMQWLSSRTCRVLSCLVVSCLVLSCIVVCCVELS